MHVSLTGEPPGTREGWVHVDNDGTAGHARADQLYEALGEGGEVSAVAEHHILHDQKFNPKTFTLHVTGPALNTPASGYMRSIQPRTKRRSPDWNGSRLLRQPAHPPHSLGLSRRCPEAGLERR